MPSLHLPDLPDNVYEALAFRAFLLKRTPAQQAVIELREVFEGRAARREEIWRSISDRIAKDGVRKLDPRPEDLIREDRDR